MKKNKKHSVMRRVFISFYLFLIVMMIIVNYMVSPLINTIYERFFEKQITSHVRELVKGVYFVTINEFLKIPRHQWSDYAAKLQEQFGYPIYIKSLPNLELSDEDRIILTKGEIVVTSKWELFYQRIGKSEEVLVMGPIANMKLGHIEVILLLWPPLVLILFPLTLVWTIPFWRSLMNIIKAANAFGDGKFNVRATISSHAVLYPLAETFNVMTDRIQHLINSHKQLTSAVSHELRTPISRIHFSLEMLENPKEGHLKDSHYLSEIRKDIDELETLVSELLSYSRLDRERPEFDFADLPLALFLEKVIGEVQKDFATLTMKVEFKIHEKDKTICCDQLMMERALSNLMRNAAQYAKKSVMMVVEEENGELLLHVNDDGPGIPEKDRIRIFEPFVRLDSSRSRDTGGYGLGLAIVYQIVTWHGGTVYASASESGGARFTIKIPNKAV